MSFTPHATDDEIRREKARARQLRASNWWTRKRSRGLCHYCGQGFAPKELTMDHLIPLIRGGRSIKQNIVTACKECNSKKKHMLPMEWEEYLGSLLESDDGDLFSPDDDLGRD